MAKLYYKKIKAGEMTIDDVPEKWGSCCAGASGC